MQSMEKFTAVVLAGGKSGRMGTDKALLSICGRTMLTWQCEKLLRLGAEQLLISGAGYRVPGTETAEDRYPDCGPLGGLASALLRARNEICLVLSVDVPLISEETLKALLRAHSEGGVPITLLRDGKGRIEPLLGIYERCLAEEMRERLARGERAVRCLLREGNHRCINVACGEEELLNCNTPEDYAHLCKIASRMERR